MKQILVYSDSLTWGIIPNTRNRLPFDDRWPGILENLLKQAGKDFRVIENCLNGRRTAWGDPYKDGRDGSQGLAQVIEMHSPLELVIIMLGTNDFQSTHDNNAWMSAQGTAKLIDIIRLAPIEPSMQTPKILIVAPPKMVKPMGKIASKFKDSELRAVDHAFELEKIAKEHSVGFFDAGTVTPASTIDGIHLDKPQHKILGGALAKKLLTDFEVL